jgi:hypothetical protein
VYWLAESFIDSSRRARSASSGFARVSSAREAAQQAKQTNNRATLGRDGVFSAIIEPDRKDALIGAIVLEELDLLVDCTTQTLRPRDPKEIVSEIE